MVKYKCFRKNLKRELDGKKRAWTIFLIILALLVIIILPSGPDDSFTTVPLLLFLGFHRYMILAGIVFGLFIINYKKVKKKIKSLTRNC